MFFGRHPGYRLRLSMPSRRWLNCQMCVLSSRQYSSACPLGSCCPLHIPDQIWLISSQKHRVWSTRQNSSRACRHLPIWLVEKRHLRSVRSMILVLSASGQHLAQWRGKEILVCWRHLDTLSWQILSTFGWPRFHWWTAPISETWSSLLLLVLKTLASWPPPSSTRPSWPLSKPLLILLISYWLHPSWWLASLRQVMVLSLSSSLCVWVCWMRMVASLAATQAAWECCLQLSSLSCCS